MHADCDDLLVPPLAEATPLRRVWWALVVVATFTVVQLKIGLVVGLVFGFGAAIRGMSSDEAISMVTENPTGMLVMVAVIEFCLLLAALFCALGFGPRRVGLDWEGVPRSLVLLSPLMVVLAVTFWLDPTVSLGDALSSRTIGIAIFAACLIGLVEELVFRGFIVGLLGGVRAPVLAVVGSSILFAAPHVIAADGTPQQHPLLVAFTVAGLFGVPFALVYLRTGSILGLAIVHAAWDALVIGARGLDQPATAVDAGADAWLVPAAVAIGYSIWYVVTSDVSLRAPVTLRRSRSDVDWDELAADADSPLVLAQIRRAVGQ